MGTITYEDKVGTALLDLPLEQHFVISEKVKPENREKFIQVVKEYIDNNFGNNENWQLEFNGDYTKIRKTNYTLVKVDNKEMNIEDFLKYKLNTIKT